MMDTIHSVATFISLALTAPALMVCLLIAIPWRSRFVEWWRAKSPVPTLVLLAGIYIGFCGSFVDNLWWGVAWSYDLAKPGSPEKLWWFHNGVYSNVIFRQTALVCAGILHVHAENRMHGEGSAERLRRTNLLILSSTFVGIAHATWMWYLQKGG